jgi:hypothetical protein
MGPLDSVMLTSAYQKLISVFYSSKRRLIHVYRASVIGQTLLQIFVLAIYCTILVFIEVFAGFRIVSNNLPFLAALSTLIAFFL